MKVPKRKTKKGIINEAIKLLSDKKHWTQGANAETASAHVVDVDNEKAVKFCLQGAVQKCSGNIHLTNTVLACIDEVARKNYGRGIIGVNDSLGYEAAMELLNKSKVVCK